jgi:3-deoxy-D-manno-octulosonate 8-phosphate phosphatase (KDO 8-P phosphatase)
MKPESFWEKAKKIKLILFDCDGILTDGGVYVSPSGDEARRFHVHDGYGIRMLQEHGIGTGIVSGTDSEAVRKRASHLGMEFVRLGSADKLAVINEILELTRLSPEEVAFVGDDLFDIPAMKAVGLSVSTPNARPEVLHLVDHVTETRGGQGAAREIAQKILEVQGKV